MSDKRIASFEELNKLAESRARAYGFLSSIYNQIPSVDFVKKVLDEAFLSLLSSLATAEALEEIKEGLNIVKGFVEKARREPLEDVHLEISVERTRLFRGISHDYGPPPPYESVYREGRVMGKVTTEVVKSYAEAGLSLSEDHKDPSDSIGIELEFMRYLCEKEAGSWRGKDKKNALKYLQSEKRFLEEHVTTWVPQFCQKVLEKAKLDFYKGMAKITRGFIESDHQLVNSLFSLGTFDVT